MAESLMRCGNCSQLALAPSLCMTKKELSIQCIGPSLPHRKRAPLKSITSGVGVLPRICAVSAPPILRMPKVICGAGGGEPVSKNSDKVAQKLVAGALAAALVLLPAGLGEAMEGYVASTEYTPIAAAALHGSTESDLAADLFAQLKGYANATDEAAAIGKTAPPPDASRKDPVTATVQSVKAAEELDVSKLAEVHGPTSIIRVVNDIPPLSAPVLAVQTAELDEEQALQGGVLERLKKGADVGRSAIGGSLAESKKLLGGGGAKVGEVLGRLKESVGGRDRALEAIPQSTQTVEESAGGLGGWFNTWVGGTAQEKETDPKPGGFFSGLQQSVQPPAKQGIGGFFQSKPPEPEKTGLAGAWQSFTRLEFLPDNVKGGALSVKNAISLLLSVLSLVLTVLSKALGLAADLIGIISRGL